MVMTYSMGSQESLETSDKLVLKEFRHSNAFEKEQKQNEREQYIKTELKLN